MLTKEEQEGVMRDERRINWILGSLLLLSMIVNSCGAA